MSAVGSPARARPARTTHGAGGCGPSTRRPDVPRGPVRRRAPDRSSRRANTRCNQERTIEQLENGVHALRMPVDELHANWAYTVMATLAWNLSRWMALVLPESPRWAEQHREEKKRVLRMRFPTFLDALMLVPAQVVRGARRATLRLLARNSWQHAFFRALDGVLAIA